VYPAIDDAEGALAVTQNMVIGTKSAQIPIDQKMRARIARAVTPEPIKGVRENDRKVDQPRQAKDGNLGGRGNGTHIVFDRELQAMPDGVPIQLRAPFLELHNLLADQRILQAAIQNAAAEETQERKLFPGRKPKVFSKERDAFQAQVVHETTRENYPFRGELLRMGTLQFQELPAHLGAERFANDPAVGDLVFFQHVQNLLPILLEGPGFGPGIGKLHETVVREDMTAEIANHGPIPVDTGQINKRGTGGIPVNSDKKWFFLH